jgi:hypothetical protein
MNDKTCVCVCVCACMCKKEHLLPVVNYYLNSAQEVCVKYEKIRLEYSVRKPSCKYVSPTVKEGRLWCVVVCDLETL